MSKSIKVGVFVLAGIVLAGIATFLIGDTEQMWNRKVEFRAAFADVAGLKPGSPVRMGGVDVGRVDAVAHAQDVNDRRIYVTLQIVRSDAPRVRVDTKAQILGKGLLGDKMVDLSTDGKGAPLAPGGMLPTLEPLDFTSTLGVLASKADHAMTNVDQTTDMLNDPKLHDDLKSSVEDLRLILDGIARKDSAAHRLLMDPSEGAKIDRVLSNLEASSERLNATLDSVRDVTDHVKTGPGLAHALLYDGEISQNAAGTMAEVHKDLEAIRTGNGLAHSLIYGDDNTQHVMGNVNAMSDDMRVMVHDVRQGKGTLGALLVDPSVYEDIRSLVGNVERNEVLRALVRYSIKADEGKRSRVRATSTRQAFPRSRPPRPVSGDRLASGRAGRWRARGLRPELRRVAARAHRGEAKEVELERDEATFARSASGRRCPTRRRRPPPGTRRASRRSARREAGTARTRRSPRSAPPTPRSIASPQSPTQ